MATNGLDLNKAFASGGLTMSSPIGIKTQSPTDNIRTSSNTTSQPQKQSSGFNLGTLATQKALNTSNKNTPGYVPLKEDGILGPLTSGAISKYSATSTGITPPPGSSEHNAFGSNVGTTPTPNSAPIPTPYTPDTGLYGKLVTDLANKSQAPSQAYLDAQAEAKRIQDQQTATAQDYAEKTKNIAGTAGFLTQQTGLQGILNNQYNTVQGALANQYAGATNRLGAANTQQQIQQSGLGTATGYAQPTSNIINVSPITGQPIAGGSLQGLAQTAGTVQGIQNAAQSNAQIAGSAGVTANQNVFNQAYKDYTDLQQSVSNVDQFGNLLTQNMGGINPFDPKFANFTLSQFRNQLSSPQQAQFDTTIAALKSKISGLLSVGGNEIPTAISADARKILDDSAPLGTLQGVLQRISAEGNILLNNSANKVNSAYAGLQGGSSSTSSTPNTSNEGTIQAGGFNFKLVNGKYVPA